ncbi:MAG: nitrogen regulation protein NR(II), partial [Nitrospinaceae bacterium]
LMSQEEAVVDGAGQKRILRISAAPARDNVGRVIGTVWLLHDMTRIKRLELEAQRNDRLRAMGGMAAGIAHEIRNPLGSIELFGSLLKRDLQDLPEQKDMAEHILSGIRHLDRIISSLLLFARSPEPSKRRCDVNALIREVLEPPALGPMPENVEVALDLGEGPVLAAGDAELLRQVFTNCIRNAAQAMPGGGKLQVSSRANPAPSKHPDRRRCITVTVADNGMGIPKAKLGNIFHPFFTTKDRGTGLGLAIVHNIIKAHQGTIDVESEEGRGATFILNIPEWEETL